MLLNSEKTRCEAHQKIIVSKDSGTSRVHRAINPEQRYEMRQYKLDGDIVQLQTCCDYLVLNDSLKNAYFIELKGGNIDEAVPQLQSGADLCKVELTGYTFYYRIVCSKVRTHDIQKNSFRKFKDKMGSRLKYQTNWMEETM